MKILSVEKLIKEPPMQGVAAVAGGSKGAPLMCEYRGRIQLVDLAAYGAPAGCIGYYYPDLFFGPPPRRRTSAVRHDHSEDRA